MKKILVVKIGAIGDVIMCMNILPKIKVENPDAKITWICGKGVKELLELYGGIDKIIEVNEEKLFKANFLKKIQEILKLYFKISFKSYDIVFIGHSDWRYRILSLPVFTKETRIFERNKKRNGVIPGRYHGFEYIRIFENKDYSSQETLPLLSLNKELKKEFEFLYNKKLKRVILAPGGAKNYLRDDFLRRWPIENYVELTKLLLKNGNEVILIGSNSDKWCNEYFSGLNVLNLIGKTSLTDLISICNVSDLLVTHDSGPLHIGIISGIKVLGIFGPTMPYEKIPPNSYFIWGGEELACRPCYDGKNYAPCKDNRCMKNISPEHVYRKINNTLNI